MKHLAALQIFLLNISYTMFICLYNTLILNPRIQHSSLTPKMYVKTVGEKMIILKFAIQYKYKHNVEIYICMKV